MKSAMQAIGIDIGGTKIALGAVNREGRVLASEVLPTEADQGFDRAVERIISAVRRLMNSRGWTAREVAGVGIGCAGPVNPVTGEINNPYTLSGWMHCNIVQPLSNALSVPVWLENDADAAAIGECLVGAGQAQDPVVMLTLGTGVGGAVIVQGGIFRGVRGEHPELGHIPIRAEGPACYCGRRGCLEALIAGPAIAEAGRKAGLADTRHVFRAAAEGHAEAACILDGVRQAVKAAIWTLLHTFLPERILLGGGMMETQGGFFLSAAREAIPRASMVPQGAVTIEPAQLGNQAGLVGAAGWAMLRAGKPA